MVPGVWKYTYLLSERPEKPGYPIQEDPLFGGLLVRLVTEGMETAYIIPPIPPMPDMPGMAFFFSGRRRQPLR